MLFGHVSRGEVVRFEGLSWRMVDPEPAGAWGERLQGFRGREPGFLEPSGPRRVVFGPYAAAKQPREG